MLSQNDINEKGIKAIEKELLNKKEVIIEENGKPKYVIMDIEKYNELRKLELDVIYVKALEDLKKGKYKEISTEKELEEHLNNL